MIPRLCGGCTAQRVAGNVIHQTQSRMGPLRHLIFFSENGDNCHWPFNLLWHFLLIWERNATCFRKSNLKIPTPRRFFRHHRWIVVPLMQASCDWSASLQMASTPTWKGQAQKPAAATALGPPLWLHQRKPRSVLTASNLKHWRLSGLRKKVAWNQTHYFEKNKSLYWLTGLGWATWNPKKSI